MQCKGCRWVAAATIVLNTKFMAMLEDWHIMVQLSQPGLSRPCLCAARARLTRLDQEQFMAAWSYFSFAENTSNILNPVHSMFFPKLSAPQKSQVFLHQAAMTSSVDATLYDSLIGWWTWSRFVLARQGSNFLSEFRKRICNHSHLNQWRQISSCLNMYDYDYTEPVDTPNILVWLYRIRHQCPQRNFWQ